MAKYAQNPGRNHWNAVKRIHRSLIHTRNFGLTYKGDRTGKLNLVGWSDADWAADLDQRRSIAAYVFIVNGTAITWSCKLLPTICLSTAESEYGALSRTGKEVISACVTLADIGQVQTEATLLCSDSQSAIALASNSRFNSRTRHIEVSQHFARHLIQSGQMKLKFVRRKHS